MKKQNTYRQQAAKKLSAFILILLFLAIPLVQGLHSHHNTDVMSKADTEKSISTPSEKCLVCDYTEGIKGKQILTNTPPVLQIPTNVSATLNTFVYTRIYKFTLQSFTNKGPPSRIA